MPHLSIGFVALVNDCRLSEGDDELTTTVACRHCVRISSPWRPREQYANIEEPQCSYISLNGLKTLRATAQKSQQHALISNHFAYPVGGPEKAGVGGSIPSLATIYNQQLTRNSRRKSGSGCLAVRQFRGQPRSQSHKLSTEHLHPLPVVFEVAEPIRLPGDRFHLVVKAFGNAVGASKAPHASDLLGPRV